jgi:beta-galactosidase
MDSNKKEQKLCCREEASTYVIEGNSFCCTLSKKTGMLTSYLYQGEECLSRPMEFQVYRAPVDNDREIEKQWKEAQLPHVQVRVYESRAVENNMGWEIRMVFSLAGVSRQKFFLGTITWSIDSDGGVDFSVQGTMDQTFPFLPRFGVRFGLEEVEQVTYYGYGPGENYCDKHRAAYLDVFSSSVEELHEDYLRPQENGNHYGCHWVNLRESDRTCEIYGTQPFEFGVSSYTREELERAKHNFELKKSDGVIVSLDYKVSGMGSNSCGPALLPKYQMKDEQILWHMYMRWAQNTKD